MRLWRSNPMNGVTRAGGEGAAGRRLGWADLVSVPICALCPARETCRGTCPCLDPAAELAGRTASIGARLIECAGGPSVEGERPYA